MTPAQTTDCLTGGLHALWREYGLPYSAAWVVYLHSVPLGAYTDRADAEWLIRTLRGECLVGGGR